MLKKRMRDESEADETIIKVDGMSCGACARTIDRALLSVEGIRSVRVDLETGEVRVEHAGTPLVKMRAAILDAGYRPLD